MSEAEFTPTPIEAETTELTSTPESNSEVRESAAHAAAIVALNETASHAEWSQDRVDTALAQLETQFGAPEVPTEEPKAGGLVSAIEAAHEEAGSERSEAAALAALDQEHKRAEILNAQETSAHSNWPQDRLDEVVAGIEAKYAAK